MEKLILNSHRRSIRLVGAFDLVCGSDTYEDTYNEKSIPYIFGKNTKSLLIQCRERGLALSVNKLTLILV